jgi:hypothetical protein
MRTLIFKPLRILGARIRQVGLAARFDGAKADKRQEADADVKAMRKWLDRPDITAAQLAELEAFERAHRY